MNETTDRDDPRLTHGIDSEPREQADVYLVLSKEERDKGFVRPYRQSYRHVSGERACQVITTMSEGIAETYARDPKFYGGTYCVGCKMHLPVDEFVWTLDGEVVGS